MKVLFISKDYNSRTDGGCIVTKRNLEFVTRIADEVDVLKIPRPSLLTRIKNILLLECYGNTTNLKKRVKYFLTQEYDLIFFDGSLYGVYLKMFVNQGFKVCCFFHNVEYKLYSDKYKIRRRLSDKIMISYVKYNEGLSAELASYKIALNERDSIGLLELYGVSVDFLFPTSFKSIDHNLLFSHNNSRPPYLLFVGSNFFANTEGLNFFFKEVAPSIKYDIRIVGNVCDAFKDSILPSNVILEGVVEDLFPYYVNALCVIAPIFSGSGLKTKSIEALRYGKFIIGSQESFEGIPNSYISRVGKLCSNKTDYINAINGLDCNSFVNKESLKVFDELYSDCAQFARFSSFLLSNINKS